MVEIYNRWPTFLQAGHNLNTYLYGMENSIPVQIPFPQPPASHLTKVPQIYLAMVTKPPQLIKASFTLYKDYDIIMNKEELDNSCHLIHLQHRCLILVKSVVQHPEQYLERLKPFKEYPKYGIKISIIWAI